MSAKSDRVVREAEQAAGIINSDKSVEPEGKADRRGEANEIVDHAKCEIEGVLYAAEDRIEEMLGSATEKIEAVVDKATHALHRHD